MLYIDCHFFSGHHLHICTFTFVNTFACLFMLFIPYWVAIAAQFQSPILLRRMNFWLTESYIVPSVPWASPQSDTTVFSIQSHIKCAWCQPCNAIFNNSSIVMHHIYFRYLHKSNTVVSTTPSTPNFIFSMPL